MPPSTEWVVSIFVLLAANALFVSVVWAAASGKIPPNPLLGIRVGNIDASDAIWMRSHRSALPLVCIGGALSLILWAISLFFSHDPTVWQPLVIAGYLTLLGFGAIATVVASVQAHKLYKTGLYADEPWVPEH